MAMSLPAAINLKAQDDDVYFTRKNSRKAVYEQTSTDVWSTNANDDWDIDAYNSRDKKKSKAGLTPTAAMDSAMAMLDSVPAANFPDTVYVYEPYRYSNYIRRFHSPYFGMQIWNPAYNPTFYDPFYWDYCYWDPWWYATPYFGFYGDWGWHHGLWNYGYYGGWGWGWHGGWYDPFPHYHGIIWAGGGGRWNGSSVGRRS